MPLPLSSDSRGDGAPQHPRGLQRKASLLARLLAPEVDDLAAVEPHLRALVDARRLPGEREIGGELGPGRRPRQLRHVVDPAAAVEHPARVLVVRLPQRARVRGDRVAADLRLVARDPRHDHERGHPDDERSGGDRVAEPRAPCDVEREHEGEKDEPRVAENRDPGDGSGDRRERERPALVGGERAQHEHGQDEPVQQLAIQMDVVPDDVGVKRGQERGDEPDSGRAQPRADLEDDERREHGDHDLCDPDGEPRPPEGQVDPSEKPPVERLRVRRRDAGQKPERPVVDQRRREAVALVDECLEDRLSLVREHQRARRRGHQHDDESGRRSSHLVGQGYFDVDGRHVAGTVRGRVLPR